MSMIVSRLFLFASLAAGLAACTPTASLWSEADARREIGVRRVQMALDLSFAPGSGELVPAERRKLDDFIGRFQIGYGDRVEIQVPGREPGLEARRTAAVLDALARSGVDAERGTATAPSGIRLAVSRSVAISPACPDWRKADDDGDPSNTPMSNLGCANLHNLSLMIADPGELVAGRSLGAGSGEPLAAGVQRYRAGKVTPLLDSETTK